MKGRRTLEQNFLGCSFRRRQGNRISHVTSSVDGGHPGRNTGRTSVTTFGSGSPLGHFQVNTSHFRSPSVKNTLHGNRHRHVVGTSKNGSRDGNASRRGASFWGHGGRVGLLRLIRSKVGRVVTIFRLIVSTYSDLSVFDMGTSDVMCSTDVLKDSLRLLQATNEYANRYFRFLGGVFKGRSHTSLRPFFEELFHSPNCNRKGKLFSFLTVLRFSGFRFGHLSSWLALMNMFFFCHSVLVGNVLSFFQLRERAVHGKKTGRRFVPFFQRSSFEGLRSYFRFFQRVNQGDF